MFTDLMEAVGVLFLAAVALEFVAVFAEQAGAARSPDDEPVKRGPAAALLALSALLTPGLLLAHGFLSTHDSDSGLRIWAMGAPVAAMIGGALIGAAAGAVAPAAAPFMRRASLVLGLTALAVTIGATWPSIQVLIEAAQNGGVILTR